jgi:cytidine deaminase
MDPNNTVALDELAPEWGVLVDAAADARQGAYAPYSQFAVGAAVRVASGRVYTGSNIENAASGLTVCAERVAIWKAVSSGERDLQALAVVTETGATPCGACRQVMAEFAEDLEVVIADTAGRAWRTSLAELLPHAFREANLGARPTVS